MADLEWPTDNDLIFLIRRESTIKEGRKPESYAKNPSSLVIRDPENPPSLGI
jgi:hypothetical protein